MENYVDKKIFKTQSLKLDHLIICDLCNTLWLVQGMEQAPDVNEATQVMLQALAANIGHAPRDELADVVERFRRQRPSTFSGSTYSIQVENWVKETKLAF